MEPVAAGGAVVGAALAAIRVFFQQKSRLKSLLQPRLRLLLFLAAAPICADYQTGLDAYQAGDYEKAMIEWKEEVNRPRVPTNLSVYREALYAIAMLYWKGEGVEQDYAVSAVWLKQAADINHPGAQVKLGYLYSTGQGVPLNYQEARRWLQLAAEQGDRDAAYNLNILDREGLGWPEDSDRPGSGGQPEPVIPASAPAASLSAVSPAELFTTNADQGADWIRTQDPEHYTIQVIALRTPDKLVEFKTLHPDWEPFAIFRPAHNAKPLWVLVQGVYTDIEAARAAAAAFPPGLQRREEILVQTFGMVQGMIE